MTAFAVVGHVTMELGRTVSSIEMRRQIVSEVAAKTMRSDPHSGAAIEAMMGVSEQRHIADLIAPETTVAETGSERLATLRAWVIENTVDIDPSSDWCLVLVVVLLELQTIIAKKERINLLRLSLEAVRACGEIEEEDYIVKKECLPLRVPPGHDDMTTWGARFESCNTWFMVMGMSRPVPA